MKKAYEKPVSEIVEMDATDVIVTSGGGATADAMNTNSGKRYPGENKGGPAGGGGGRDYSTMLING